MDFNDTVRYNLAKSFTELAIQNNLFSQYENGSETAKDIVDFFNTVLETVGIPSSED